MKTQEPLFILEIANNHMGSLDHGLEIIKKYSEAISDFKNKFEFVFKLQYRALDTFIHPSFQGRKDIKFVKRFSETRLLEADFIRLIHEIRKQGFRAMCTPFDEPSVDMVEKHGFDYLKIGSCSFMDWPLLERLAAAKLPIIASTAGAQADEIDRVVSFFLNRKRDLAILHCVGTYPTPTDQMQLNQIGWLRQRYPNLRIGFSSHENPDDTDVIMGAIGQGASIFERHVGIPTPENPLNDYSLNPAQFQAWLAKAAKGIVLCGKAGERTTGGQIEVEQLRSLSRAVFAKKDLHPGDHLDFSDYTLAIPSVPGQLLVRDLSKYCQIKLQKPVLAGDPIFSSSVVVTDYQKRIREIIKEVRTLLNQAAVILPRAQNELEISHHYGIEKFHEVGAVLLNYINREYCKKILVMLPGQRHPEHYHRQKEETFYVVWGEMTVTLDGEVKRCLPGEMILVNQEVRHSMSTQQGVVFEEISSNHSPTDSFYIDESIINNNRRKTYLNFWLA